MSTILERVPVERIRLEAREIHFGRTVATLLTGLLWLVGWVVAKVFSVLWYAVAWSFAAAKVGWQDARKPKSGDGG